MTYEDMWRCLATIYGEREARAIARTVLEMRFGWTATDVLTCKDKHLCGKDKAECEKMMGRLMAYEPVQYVLGKADFCGREFFVDRNVLIPRPETEELCTMIVEREQAQPKVRAASWGSQNEADGSMPGLSILDVCTGSGCIAITLALCLPGAKVHATDMYDEVLDTAKRNARALGADVLFSKQDALAMPFEECLWDVIVSNPPYVCESERGEMGKNVLVYEPHEALFVPDDAPLIFYEAIAKYARKALKSGGRLYFEINPVHACSLVAMLEGMRFCDITLHDDIYGKQRFCTCNNF